MTSFTKLWHCFKRIQLRYYVFSITHLCRKSRKMARNQGFPDLDTHLSRLSKCSRLSQVLFVELAEVPAYYYPAHLSKSRKGITNQILTFFLKFQILSRIVAQTNLKRRGTAVPRNCQQGKQLFVKEVTSFAKTSCEAGGAKW